MLMLLSDFLIWWYGSGWKQAAKNIKSRLQSVADNFSVSQLLGTLFEPWRRIISYPGASLGEKLRAWADNMFSRVIGFIVRFFVLIAALVVAIAVIILTLVEVLIWPLLPVSPIILIVAAITL